MNKCTNYCINGSCSNCGNCCTELIPLTINEVKLIKAYVKEKQIKPYSEVFFKYNNKQSTNLMCPFRDMENKKCMIYEVRPKICRLFKCNQDEKTITVHKNNCHKKAHYNKSKNPKDRITKLYSTRELIYGDELDTIRILAGNLVKENLPIDLDAIKLMLIKFERNDLAIEEKINKVLDEYKNGNVGDDVNG